MSPPHRSRTSTGIVAAGLLVVAAAVLVLAWTLGGGEDSRPVSEHERQRTAIEPDGEPTSPELAAARTAAMRFTDAYLALSFAPRRGDVDALPNVTPELRESIRRTPPNRTTAAGARRPQVDDVVVYHPVETATDTAAAAVTLRDGDGSYPLLFRLERIRGTWSVTRFGE